MHEKPGKRREAGAFLFSGSVSGWIKSDDGYAADVCRTLEYRAGVLSWLRFEGCSMYDLSRRRVLGALAAVAATSALARGQRAPCCGAVTAAGLRLGTFLDGMH